MKLEIENKEQKNQSVNSNETKASKIQIQSNQKMSEAVEKKSHQSGNVEAKNKSKSPEISVIGSGISRERSFVRTNSQQQHHNNKRRSLAFASQANALHQQQLRMKPALEIYRPPSNESIFYK